MASLSTKFLPNLEVRLKLLLSGAEVAIHVEGAVHACQRAYMSVHAFSSGRHLWNTKMALYLCYRMALSLSRAPAAHHSVRLHIQAQSRETRRVVVVATQVALHPCRMGALCSAQLQKSLLAQNVSKRLMSLGFGRNSCFLSSLPQLSSSESS